QGAAVLVQFDADPAADGVHLQWRIGSPVSFSSLVLERADAENGPWNTVDAERQGDGLITTVIDRSAVGGRQYWYRLIGTTTYGQSMTFGPVAARAAEQLTEFAITRIHPNPSRGMMQLDFTVPV